MLHLSPAGMALSDSAELLLLLLLPLSRHAAGALACILLHG